MPYDVIGIIGFDAGMHDIAGGYADHFYVGWGYRTGNSKTGPYAFAYNGPTSNAFRVLCNGPNTPYTDVVVGYHIYLGSNLGFNDNWLFRWLDQQGNQMGGWYATDLGGPGTGEGTRIYQSDGSYSWFQHDVWGSSRRDKWVFVEHWFSARLNTWQMRIDEQHIWTWNYDYDNHGTDIYYHDIGNDNQAGEVRIDNVYALGANGEAPPFWGETEVLSLQPRGNGQYSEWFGHDGDQVDNYLNVDQATPSMDAEFNFAQDANIKDTYEFEDLSPLTDGTFVKAVQVDAFSQWTGGPETTASARGIAYHAGASPTLVSSPESQSANDDINVEGFTMEKNPATGTYWTEQEVNEYEFGIEFLGQDP